jgi:NADPH:quinone reductase-like Zn-dependent oxidoreductase
VGVASVRVSEVLDIVDLSDPTPVPGQQLYEVSAAGVDSADTHHRLSSD